MPATLIARDDARVTTTPNAVMTTLASPTQGETADLSLWRVAMRPGQSGPEHRFDTDQAWHLLEGSATVVVDGRDHELVPGDTIVIPRDVVRRISTDTGAALVVTGSSAGRATPVVSGGDGEPVAPAWTA